MQYHVKQDSFTQIEKAGCGLYCPGIKNAQADG